MDAALQITELGPADAAHAIPDLAAILADCVAGGASVSFIAGFGQAEAETYFAGVAAEVARGETALIGALRDAQWIGTVQLGLAMPPNQPHRADVKKMLVHRSARRRGVASALLTAVESAARARGRTLLVLDAVTGGDAARLYARMGWTRVGVIPDYALYPDGRYCDTTYFYKRV